MKKVLRKIAAIVTVVSMCMLSFTGCSETKSGGSSSSGKESDTINLGCVLPVTGSVPNLGSAMKNGAELAIEEINNAGGINGKKIKATIEDDENKPATAPNAITKLIEQDKVDAVLGTYASSCSIAMAPIAAQNKKVMLSIGSTNAKVTSEGGEYVFRACFIDPFQGKIAAEYAYNDLDAKKVAVLYDVGKDYCVGISDTFKETITSLGGEIAYEGKYNTGESDFKSYLTEIKNKGVKVLYIPDDYDVVGLIAKQIKEIGLEVQLLGSDSWSDPGLIEVGGDAVEGAYFTDHVSIKSEKLAKFAETYKNKFGQDPGAFSVLAYDSVYIISAAIKNAGSTDSDAIKDALNKLDEDCGTTHYKFDENRDPIKSVVINQVKNGQFEFVKEIEPK